jgi:hypothetical protein
MEVTKMALEAKKYTSVKSEYIKAKIQVSNWSDKFRRNYIDDLIELENYVLYGPTGWAHAMLLRNLEDHYQREYEKIFRELKPKVHQRQKEQKKQQELESKQYWKTVKEENRALEERQRRNWLEAAGSYEERPPTADGK